MRYQRLKNVFVTLSTKLHKHQHVIYQPTTFNSNKFSSPYKNYTTGEQGTNKPLHTCDKHGEIADFQIHVGSKSFPEYPARSMQEAFCQLRRTLGSHDQHNSIDITGHEYKADRTPGNPTMI